jgi:integrase
MGNVIPLTKIENSPNCQSEQPPSDPYHAKRARIYIIEDEVDLICKHASKQNRNRDRAMYRLGFEQGLRVSEIRNCEWTMIDFKERIFKAVRLKNSLTTVHPISDKLVSYLKAWKKEQEEVYGAQRYVFTTR